VDAAVFAVISGKSSICRGDSKNIAWNCSADVAAVILLTTEIDAATLSGTNTNDLICEFTLISNRMLGRAQSAELGNF